MRGYDLCTPRSGSSARDPDGSPCARAATLSAASGPVQHARPPTGPLPLVTVITPAYNVEAYLDETVTSVLAQTRGDFEYLIVDDGSTDGTAEIASRFARTDPRVAVVAGRHAGSAAARNLALASARGTYVAFCDGDDRWDPRFLERAVFVLETAPSEVGAVFSAFRLMDQHGQPSLTARVAEPGDYDAERMLAGMCRPGNGSCLLLRRTCFDEAGLFDSSLDSCIDLDMWMRINLGSQTPLFRFLPEVLVEWRQRPGSISSNGGKRVDGLAEMLRRYGGVLSVESASAAHLWPAVTAFCAGRDTLASAWLGTVRRGDPRFFLRGRNGLVLGVFAVTGPRLGRVLHRSALRGVRVLSAGRSALPALRARAART